jgi:O-phosphoseryl-tRNA(Cys) synthetase
MTTDYGFYSQQQLQELDGSDLSFEIADAALLNNKQGDEYLDLLIAELKRRECNDVTLVELSQ